MDDMAPGFRFYPTEEELVSFYLSNKLDGKREDLDKLINQIIPVVNIYNFNPWDLPLYLCHKDPEQWFFFIPRQESEARGGRPKRSTASGYWKATGSPGYVYSSNSRPIGVKRTMVFYNGKAPIGKKTEWKMNEYKAIDGDISSTNAAPPLRQEFSLCRVYKKSKCLRSFDRRPAPGVALPPALVSQQGNVTSGVVGGKPHNLENTQITGKATTSSSLESSLSGNHHENRSTQAWGSSSNGSRMVVDDESSFWPDLAELWDSVNY